MTLDPIDTRKTVLDLMNTTRRAWRISERGLQLDQQDEGEGDHFAWPVGEARFANQIDDRLERFLREQE